VADLHSNELNNQGTASSGALQSPRWEHTTRDSERLKFGLSGTRTAQLNQALLMIRITLVALAAVNATCSPRRR
jgi:hypothetical protein